MINFSHNFYSILREERLELSHRRYWYLKPARLPIPPLSQIFGWMMGFEPTTTGTTNQGSTTELHPPFYYYNIRAWKDSNLRPYRSQRYTLIQLSYRRIIRGDRIRTYDLLVPNQPRYQAALHPVFMLLYLQIRLMKLFVSLDYNPKLFLRLNL